MTSRSSAFSFKGRIVPIAEVARQLHVAHILEGSVRKSGDRVRVTVQLIEARSDTHLWSETYDRTIQDIFAVQDEIAGAVVAQLKITLLGAAPKARDVDPKAFALFLQARQTAREAPEGAMERASALYQLALAVDPDYLEAWVGLASCFSGQANEGLRPIDEALRLAREALGAALSIDPDFAPAHSLLGGLSIWWDGNLATAAKHYLRALALGPSDPGILASATVLTRSLGRLEETIAFAEFVAARDPLNAERYLDLAETYRLAGRLEDAIATYRIAQSLAPGGILQPYTLGFAQLLKGDSQAALASMQPVGEDVLRLAGSAMANHSLGRHPASDSALAEMIVRGEKFAAYNVACVLAYRQESDRAFEWLNKALANRDPGLKSEIVLEPLLASLHDDPRWLPFLRKIGRSPEQLAAVEFKVTLPR